MKCKICQGDMWDNREKKSKGELKSNYPDYKCKDKNCNGVIWPPKDTTPQTVGEYEKKNEWKKPASTDDVRGRVRNNVAVAFIGLNAGMPELPSLDESTKNLMEDWVNYIMNGS